MFGSNTLTLGPTSFAAVAAAGVGFVALWANFKRSINQIFFSGSLHVAAWLLLLDQTVRASEGLTWLRYTCSVGALTAFHLWLIKETILFEETPLFRRFNRGRWWALAIGILGVLPLTDFFIPGHSRTDAKVFGPGYPIFIVGVVSVFFVLLRVTLVQMRAQVGLKRIELQMILIGGSAAALTILLLMGLRSVLGLPWLVRLQPFVIFLFYTGTVIAITTHRVFDARQILLVCLQKVLLVAVVAVFAFFFDAVIGLVLPEPVDLLVTTAVALWFAAIIKSWLDKLLQFYPESTSVREAAFAAGRREKKITGLEAAFATILKGWGHTELAFVASGSQGMLRGTGVELAEDSAAFKSLKQLRWATPERLARERVTQERQALGQFLHQNGLGAVVLSEGSAIKTLVGVGIPASRRPFTYPQITQLMELAAIIESAMERAHFAVKVQHAEQLATVGLLGASLAHEIRNPLVTIKTFVQLLPKHHQDPAFREKFFALIGDEVTRIDRLTEQLLDLASPRAYQAHPTDLHPILRTSIELVAAKAINKRIEFLTDFQAAPDRVLTDASATKQVLLNLCFNAIQAVETVDGERWIKVATRNVPKGVEMVVADSGPGIAPEIRPRLFQPFQTTKSSGFGLGLAICSDILTGLDATIAVDPSQPGQGATFRIVFPCPV